jgi:hypothetical protein
VPGYFFPWTDYDSQANCAVGQLFNQQGMPNLHDTMMVALSLLSQASKSGNLSIVTDNPLLGNIVSTVNNANTECGAGIIEQPYKGDIPPNSTVRPNSNAMMVSVSRAAMSSTLGPAYEPTLAATNSAMQALELFCKQALSRYMAWDWVEEEDRMGPALPPTYFYSSFSINSFNCEVSGSLDFNQTFDLVTNLEVLAATGLDTCTGVSGYPVEHIANMTISILRFTVKQYCIIDVDDSNWWTCPALADRVDTNQNHTSAMHTGLLRMAVAHLMENVTQFVPESQQRLSELATVLNATMVCRLDNNMDGVWDFDCPACAGPLLSVTSSAVTLLSLSSSNFYHPLFAQPPPTPPPTTTTTLPPTSTSPTTTTTTTTAPVTTVNPTETPTSTSGTATPSGSSTTTTSTTTTTTTTTSPVPSTEPPPSSPPPPSPTNYNGLLLGMCCVGAALALTLGVVAYRRHRHRRLMEERRALLMQSTPSFNAGFY